MTYEEDSNKFNSQLEEQRILDNHNHYQMLVSIQRHDSQLLYEFNNAARKTDERNEEEGEVDDSYREEKEEPPVRYWQKEIIEEIQVTPMHLEYQICFQWLLCLQRSL